jgi:hypothetical protein
MIMLKKQFKFKLLLLIGLICVGFIGCAGGKSPQMLAHIEFCNRNYDDAISYYKQVVDKSFEKKTKDYVIHLLNYGILNYYGGYLNEAYKSFWAAYQVDAADIGTASKVTELIKSGSHRVYKMEKREKAILHFYLGMIFCMQQDYEKALVEFGKVHLIEEQKPKLPLVTFMSGKTYELFDKLDDAKVEYNAVQQITQKDPEPYSYLELAQTFSTLQKQDEFEKNLAEYNRIKSPDMETVTSIPIRGLKKALVLIDIDSAKNIDKCDIYMNGKFAGCAEPIETYSPGVTAGEVMRKMMKEVAGALAREAIKKIPIFGAFSSLIFGSNSDYDNRNWFYAPAVTYYFVGYFHDDIAEIGVKLFKKGKSKGDFLFNASYKPVVKINNQLILPVRYQGK